MDFFAKNLQKWYKINKRDLPWRQISDPYKIWLSEIILQQTQVVQGLSYYKKFVKTYPTVAHLAKAPADEVMKLWQGLGYYSRARNLHETAKIIVKEHKGLFPKTHEQIRNLKGVGDYTAAAIASFAYNLPHAVVDGNVYRVLSRVFGVELPIDTTEGKKYFNQLAKELLPKSNVAEYNQAIMEFGALYCRPANPDCGGCIFNSQCLAFQKKQVQVLPVKSKKTKVTNRYFNYIVFTYKNNTYIRKRTAKDIWQGLFEFVLIETTQRAKPQQILKHAIFKEATKEISFSVSKISSEYKHVLSHQNLHAVFYWIELSKPIADKSLKKVNLNAIEAFATPRLIEKHLKDGNILK